MRRLSRCSHAAKMSRHRQPRGLQAAAAMPGAVAGLRAGSTRGVSSGGCLLAHPSKRKHDLPGEDAYFVHDGDGVVVVGVADGTSVAGTSGTSAPPPRLPATRKCGLLSHVPH